jgi:hypothetical protein
MTICQYSQVIDFVCRIPFELHTDRSVGLKELGERASLHLRFAYKPLLALFGIAAFWSILIAVVREDPQQPTLLLAVYGDMITPAVLGGVACGLVMNDPCLDIVLATPSRLWAIMLSRLVILVGGASLVWGLLVVTTWLLVVPRSLETNMAQLHLGGLVSQGAFASLGLWIALQFRSAISGGIIIAAAWAGSLLAREAFLSSTAGQAVFPFITLFVPDSPVWLLNRVLFGGFSFFAIVLALRLSLDEEALVLSKGTAEDTE